METSTWKKVVCYVVSFVLVIGMSAGTSFLVAKKQTGVVSAPQAKSAYELAVESGYNGTIEEWLASLVGETGENGKRKNTADQMPALVGGIFIWILR